MMTSDDKVGGWVKKGQNHDDVILEWSLIKRQLPLSFFLKPQIIGGLILNKPPSFSNSASAVCSYI